MAKVIYDPDLKSLTISLGESTIKLDNVDGFEFAASPGVEEEWPGIFLSPSEIATLSKMIEYVLGKIKISEQATKDLSHIQSQLSGLSRGQSSQEAV